MKLPALSHLHTLSLRGALLAVLIPGLILVGSIELWQTWRTAESAANAAYDRSLLGAIKSIDANISTASGGLAVELPYRMLEFFELTASGNVYFRVTTENGLVEIGNADLPLPAGVLITNQPVFQDATYFDELVRVASYARVLENPISGGEMGQRLVIQVAETLDSRQAFARALVLESVARDVLLMAVAISLVVLAVSWALRPLERLRREVRARAPQDLRPMDALQMPAEVRPLVDAVNFHIERNRQHAAARQRFVDDASHQLRTPLTTLLTQAGFALRETDPQRQHTALAAIKTQLEETIHQTNQMLALARVDSSEFVKELQDVTAVCEKVTRDWWPEARLKSIDLGFEPGLQPLYANVHSGLLKEALSNLLHNAIRYTEGGGHVTVQLQHRADRCWITVVDNGPGMSSAEIERAGERFFRGSNVTQPGSGLGLAIVRSIVARLDAELQLVNVATGCGLQASIVLPRCAKNDFPTPKP